MFLRSPGVEGLTWMVPEACKSPIATLLKGCGYRLGPSPVLYCIIPYWDLDIWSRTTPTWFSTVSRATPNTVQTLQSPVPTPLSRDNIDWTAQTCTLHRYIQYVQISQACSREERHVIHGHQSSSRTVKDSRKPNSGARVASGAKGSAKVRLMWERQVVRWIWGPDALLPESPLQSFAAPAAHIL